MSRAINNLLNGSKGLLEKYGYVEEERPVVKKRVNESLNESLDKEKAQYILSNVFYQNGKIDKVDYNELLDLMDESESAFGKRLVELGIKNDFYKELKKDESLNEAKKDDELPPDPEAVKLDANRGINELAADEIAAIDNYSEVIQTIKDGNMDHKDAVVDKLQQLKSDKLKNLDALNAITKDIAFKKTAEVQVEEPIEFDIAEESLNECDNIESEQPKEDPAELKRHGDSNYRRRIHARTDRLKNKGDSNIVRYHRGVRK